MSDEFEPTDEDLDALTELERAVHPDESQEEYAKRLFRESAGTAAMKIIQLNRTSGSERLVFETGKYILDRAIGKISDAPAGDLTPLEKMMKDLQDHANTSGSK